MIQVKEADRPYCIGCFERDVDKAYELRFGNPMSTTVIAICEKCKKALKDKL